MASPPLSRIRASWPRLLAGLLAGIWLLLCWRVGPPAGDFANYWTSAALWWEGADLGRIYDYRWFTDQAARHGFDQQLVGFPVLTPPSVLLAVPLLGLGLSWALRVWWLAQAALGLVLAWLLARSTDRAVWLGIAGLLAFWPALRAHLVQGQFHLPVVCALTLGWLALRRGQDTLGGVCWGLAIGLKIHAWPLLPIMLLARRWRVAGVIFGTLVLGGLVSVALVGWPLHVLWWREIVPAAASGWFTHPWHLSFQGMGHALRRALVYHPSLNPLPFMDAPLLAARLGIGFNLAVVGITLASGIHCSRLSPERQTRLIAAGAFAAMASGAVLSSYHMVLLLPPLAWALDALLRNGRPIRAAMVGLCGIAIPWCPIDPGLSTAGALDLLWLLRAVPRMWLCLLLLILILPWTRSGVRWGARLAALVLAGLVALSHSKTAGAPLDGAQPLDGPGFPLVSAELTRTADGSLWWSALSSDRDGHPGQGWVGYRLGPDQQEPELVAWDPDVHVWDPSPTSPDTVAWQRGSTGARVRVAAPGPEGGRLSTVIFDGQQDIVWTTSSGEQRRITRDPGHDSDPVWDPQRGRIWFLSDRGTGVRTLRLWWTVPPTRAD